jgi:hypothetical protein
MKNNSFYFKWQPFLLGFLIGFFGVIIALFAREDRRDKIYSSIIGCCLGFLVTMLMIKYGVVEFK